MTDQSTTDALAAAAEVRRAQARQPPQEGPPTVRTGPRGLIAAGLAETYRESETPMQRAQRTAGDLYHPEVDDDLIDTVQRMDATGIRVSPATRIAAGFAETSRNAHQRGTNQ